MTTVQRIRTVSEFHRLRDLPKPEHPLISVVDYSDIKLSPEMNSVSWVLDFYQISVKRGVGAKMKYGQQQYDFDEGVMFFIAPGQVFRIEVAVNSVAVNSVAVNSVAVNSVAVNSVAVNSVAVNSVDPTLVEQRSGWMLLIHPDFFWNTSLAKTIRQHDYFDYTVAEALFLSDREETVLNTIVQTIRQEYHATIDTFSQAIVISQLETLLNYADRFYHRQFITRKINSHVLLNRLENALATYFEGDSLRTTGLPTVQYMADQLNVSPKYLSSLLKVLTGQTAQQHIHEKLIERAKAILSTTALSVSEIAYELGFGHPQSFSKLFKAKTHFSPLEFRDSVTSN